MERELVREVRTVFSFAVIYCLVFSRVVKVRGAFSRDNYLEALSKSILFYEGQRSGKLPPNQRVTWREDSGLSDGSSQNVDLTGGYYDAGDHVKFGFPMAFTATLLSWSVIENADELQRAGELLNAQTAIRWATDYLLKAACHPIALWVQVGNPYSDHSCWERPEQMDTPRIAYQVTPQNPGSDVAAETAAALAAASLVFQHNNPSYSAKLLSTAKQVFTFADQHRGCYSDSLGYAVSPFYTSYSGYKDELLWGASWLYKASQDESYLQYIRDNGAALGGTSETYLLSWDNKYCGAQILLTKEFFSGCGNDLEIYKTVADECICSMIPGTPSSSTKFTPGGLLYVEGESNLQYVTNAAFVLLTYSKYLASSSHTVSCGNTLLQPEQLASFAKKQVDYILGDNPSGFSYMVGFGSKYPQHVHHRASSLPSLRTYSNKIQCNDGFAWYRSETPNPNEHMGAVVGGPDQNDYFSDNRADYQQAEPATYMNAGLIGALAQISAASSY
ncbi:hypothetical protein O6H91_04G088600 [Diphasiastrum complanatum]|uniref:Uncharacterized protein n=1 Tax=Diphasiastrum complanatum TaxID=34168 RepID=A0ACC2DZC7_DIPCM|nr:hypothetical protein O6H91_04G088600 [Diphasiastrum complanatum]